MEMLMVVAMYMGLSLWFVASGIVDLARKGPGRDLAAAVAIVVMGGLIPVMKLVIGQIPRISNDMSVLLAPAAILATFGAVFAIGWFSGKLVERPLLRSWERRRAAAEAG